MKMTERRDMSPMNVSVIAFKEEGSWVAQCLEYDICAQADSLAELGPEFERTFIANFAVALELGQEPFSQIEPAPQKYWDLYKKATVKVEMERPPLRSPTQTPSISPTIKLFENHAA